MKRDWTDLIYLLQGTPRQKAAYSILAEILPKLSAFDPVLTGTIPLNIDVPDSDLDIVCYTPDLEKFKRVLTENFGHFQNFILTQSIIDELPTVIVRFERNNFAFEIFGQSRPVIRQKAFRHMIVEARLLQYGGEKIRQQIRQLKQTGLKTEPAFAIAFNLTGDPYQTLLELSDLPAEELYQTIFNKT
ncbi:MAG: DUF4269 domain-containing protein [Cyanobacteria bacterium SBLK]|nr:DUF4269 domain-containing protein [Cyanobacteria bacterium SBLK]